MTNQEVAALIARAAFSRYERWRASLGKDSKLKAEDIEKARPKAILETPAIGMPLGIQEACQYALGIAERLKAERGPATPFLVLWVGIAVGLLASAGDLSPEDLEEVEAWAKRLSLREAGAAAG